MISYEQVARPDILTPLWQKCFDDSAAEIQTFWRFTERQVSAFAALDGKTPVSMLCALPTTLIDDCGEALHAAYFYAVCTAPEYRKQGLCSELIAYAERALRGFDAYILVPDGEKLFWFYKKLGYQTAFYHSRYEISAQQSDVKITKINADTYRNIRELQLYGSFVSFDVSLLELQRCSSEASGAGLYRLEAADTVCCAAAEKQDDCLLIKELLPYCPEAAAALAQKLGCQKAVVSTQGDDLPFGMIKPLRPIALPENSYLGLAFD